MSKTSEILQSRRVDRITKSIMGLVTGNPIVEEPSPIMKGQDHRSRSPIHPANKQATASSRSKQHRA